MNVLPSILRNFESNREAIIQALIQSSTLINLICIFKCCKNVKVDAILILKFSFAFSKQRNN